MDYENFKESFTEALQEDLYGKGIEARFDMKSVEKLNNEGYDAVTVTPADSNIGVTLNVEAFYKAHEDGASMDEVVSKASDTVIRGFDNQPSIDVASLMDYEQMKDKLIMEVVSTEANADMLANVPHVEMEDMSVVYCSMNEKINKIADRYISCPVCRRKADQGKLISKDYKCECGAEYTALVSKWFVTTILKDPNDKGKPLQERLEEYQKRLFSLAE